MFSFGRLLTIGILGALIYAGFFAVPPGDRAQAPYRADAVADAQLAAWRAVKAKEDFSVYFSAVRMLREQHRYTWFRAAQAGFYLSRAMTRFAEMQARYERALPDLEDEAAIEKTWMNASFDPVVVARARLDWWVTRKLPNLNSLDHIGPLIEEEYRLRYGLRAGRAADAAMRMAQAADLFDQAGIDPDWTPIQKQLVQSYESLQAAIRQARASQ